MMQNLWMGAKAAAAVAPLVTRLIDGDGTVGAREANWIQNRENMHWEREREHRQLQNTQKLFAMQNDQMKKQYENQFGWLVEGAQKAGFNPLTVLGTAGSHGGGSAPGSGSPLTSHVPDQVSIGGVLSDALSGVADVLDPIDRERRKLENELLEKRIEQVDNEERRLGQMPELRRTSSEVRGDKPPLTPEGPEEPEVLEELVEGSSGLTLANPENPPEAETDIWAWLRDGSFSENIRAVIKKNLKKDYEDYLKTADDRYRANITSPARNPRPGYGSAEIYETIEERAKHRKRMERERAEHKNAAITKKLTGEWPRWYVKKYGM